MKGEENRLNKRRLVVFSGAGMSADSGLKTFRDNNGLWEDHDVSEVATPAAWKANPKLVLRFYNERRKQLYRALPNKAHELVAQLENLFEVCVVTQNIDDLHERAGSTNVIHLHGELKKVQSEKYPDLVYSWDKELLELGDLCERGHQLRPHVVWFGEEVPKIPEAIQQIQMADILIVIGSSLNVYPAAGLIHYAPDVAKCFLIDPNPVGMGLSENWEVIAKSAPEGMEMLYKAFSA